ncbi:MAG: 50S ribosomal protein L21 [Spirochaetaceae bacterium]|nr:50S ribosomal protein L21 [Spirochaetaceae bacterium]
MYALVEILGKQYKAIEGRTMQVDLLNLEVGAELTYETVLALVDENSAKFGAPYVAGVKVIATVVEDIKKGDKIKVYKFHKRKGYRRTQGHREKYSLIKIEQIAK